MIVYIASTINQIQKVEFKLVLWAGNLQFSQNSTKGFCATFLAPPWGMYNISSK